MSFLCLYPSLSHALGKCSKDLFILLIYFYFFLLHWVFVAACGLSLVAVSGGYSSFQCTGFSLWWLLLLQSTGFRYADFSSCSTWTQQLWLAGSRAQAQQLCHTHGLSCSAACGIFPDQGSNPSPLHWWQILNHCATREVQDLFNFLTSPHYPRGLLIVFYG